jgi:single-stranded-DNA-specific exonuclease
VALGTVCDVVPLTGLNRAFVHQGLKVAGRGGTVGLDALARVAGLDGVGKARDFGFVLGPRLNAGSRTGRSTLAARLLLTDDASEAAGLAERLHELNGQRQATERLVLEAAEREAAEQARADCRCSSSPATAGTRAWSASSPRGWSSATTGRPS